MGDIAVPASAPININCLIAHHNNYQKDLKDLIDLYVSDTKKKFSLLHKALSQKNYPNFLSAARDIRRRSLDIGAVQFSHACLALELSAQEMRFEGLHPYLLELESQFQAVEQCLLVIQQEDAISMKVKFNCVTN